MKTKSKTKKNTITLGEYLEQTDGRLVLNKDRREFPITDQEFVMGEDSILDHEGDIDSDGDWIGIGYYGGLPILCYKVGETKYRQLHRDYMIDCGYVRCRPDHKEAEEIDGIWYRRD